MTPREYQKFRRERAERHHREERESLRIIQKTAELPWESQEIELFLPRKLDDDARAAETFARENDEK